MKYMFLFLMFSVVSFGQAKVNYASIDKKMDAIPDSLTKSTDSIAHYITTNFKTESEKIRAVFYWIASNVTYDLDNMYVVNYKETKEERIVKTLKTKIGICYDYSLVFNEIADAVGVKSVLISGYTKLNGRVGSLSHAWCAAKIDSKWYLFDPTWGTGYLKSSNKNYTRNTNNSFFKIDPEIMILSHMPFDYLWQFIDYTVTNQEFIDGVYAGDETKEKFDFLKEIIRYESLSKANQFFESSQRIEKNGMKNQFISQAYVDAMNRWNYEKNNEKRAKFDENSSKINAVSKQCSEAVKNLNDFVNYRNRQFKPLVSDIEIKRKIEEPRGVLVKCEAIISEIRVSDDNNRNNLGEFENDISQLILKADEQLQFVNLYLAKPKSVRETMFYTAVRSSKSK
nr:transglutaminase domain-containing protein [uncultured Flavobacterium sp.]